MYFSFIEKLNDFDQNRATSGSSSKSQVLDLKTLAIFIQSTENKCKALSYEDTLYFLCIFHLNEASSFWAMLEFVDLVLFPFRHLLLITAETSITLITLNSLVIKIWK